MNRDYYIDSIKGLIIFFMIFGHTFPYFSHSFFGITWRELFSITVPMFVAISGYFTANKLGLRDNGKFWRSHVLKIYVPCLIWSLPFINYTNPTFLDIARLFLCDYSIYYYAFILLQLYAVPYLFKQREVSLKLLIWTTLLAIIWFFGIIWITKIQGIQMLSIFRMGLLPGYLCFYCLGAYIRQNNMQLRRKWLYIIAFILALAGCTAEFYFLQHLGHTYRGIKCCTIVMAMIGITGFLTWHPTVKPNLLSVVGRNSYAYYLIHIHFLVMFEAWIARTSWVISSLLIFIATTIVIYILRWILRERASWLGIY